MSVPYQGAPESISSVMRNDTQMYFGPVNIASEMVTAGKVRVLAVATAERAPTMKDVPTIAESGLPGFKYDAWFGVMAPVKTPQNIVTKLNSEISEVLDREDVRSRLVGTGALPLHDSVADFNAIIANDTAKFATMFPDGIK